MLARDDLERVEKRHVHFNLGVIYHRKGDMDNALTQWKDAALLPIGEDETVLDAQEMELSAASLMNLGAHFVLSNDAEKGLGYLQAAADIDPDDGEIRYNLAATLASLGKHEVAIQEFQAAQERGIETAREAIEQLQKIKD